MKDIKNIDNEKLFTIPSHLWDSELLCYLYPSKFKHAEEKKAAVILHKICYASHTDLSSLETIEKLHLTEDERDIIIKNDWANSSNLEVRARCNDVLSRYQKDKRKSKIKASESYLEAFKVTVRLSNSFNQEVTPQVTPQDIPQVTSQVYTLIECMNNGEDFMREELQEILKLKDRENFRLNYLKPALDQGLIEMTIPDKPTSKLQRYKLTYKGKRLIDAIFKK